MNSRFYQMVTIVGDVIDVAADRKGEPSFKVRLLSNDEVAEFIGDPTSSRSPQISTGLVRIASQVDPSLPLLSAP
jgi:hypothetical protein